MQLLDSKYFSCILSLLFVVQGAFAQPTPDSTAVLDTSALADVVITGQYVPGSATRSVHGVRVIGREKIAAMGAQTLTDLLSNELNVRIGQDNALGASISLQGISGQNVKILIDGVPMVGRMNGNIDLSQINLRDVERVEIVEGPMAVNYGTDALAGTINIITKKAKQDKVSLAARTYYESAGHYNASGRVTGRLGQHTLSLSGGRNYFDGWRAGDPAFSYVHRAPADSARFQDWKPKGQHFADFCWNYYLKTIRLGYAGRYFDEHVTNRGLPRAPYQETAFDDHYRTWRLDNILDASGQVTTSSYLTGFVALNQYRRIKNTYYRDLTTLSEALTTNPGDQDTTQFLAFASRATLATQWKNPRLRHEVGIDLRHEVGHGLRIADGQQVIGDYAVFGSLEYRPWAAWVVKPGLRYAYNTAYASPLLPSLNLKYDVGGFTFRGSYARGYRAPALKELYLYFYDVNHSIGGNPDLKPERSDSYRLSAAWQNKAGTLKADGAAFHNDIRDLIALALVQGNEYTYFNVGRYKTLGAQVGGEWKWKGLTLSGGVSYTGRYNALSELEGETVETYSFSPEARGNVNYRWAKQGLVVALFYKYTGRLPGYLQDDGGGVAQTEMGDYHTADASLQKQFWEGRLSLSLGCKNIFNVTNVQGYLEGQAHTGAAGTMAVGYGRSYFAGLEFQWGKL